ncbi:hypothetical protein ID866_11200 [Astraeus odoratus]|nr:hypothetical protein ID866_11200 [Astraeus odoratus]
MSSGNKNAMPINWQEVPNKELGLDEADPKDVTMAKLQEKFRCKRVQEAEEAKKCREAKEAKKRAREAKEAKKRACEAEVWCWEVAATERQREAEQQREAERQEAERAKEAKKRQHAESKAGPSGARGQEPKCMQCAKASAVCIMGLGMKRKMACDWCSCNKEKFEVLWGLRKGVATMAESNQDLAQVLYHGFQSVDTLVNEVQIFGAKGFHPKLAPESEPAKDELQETLREVEELQEECLEWVMEHLQMRKEWMWQEEAALTKHLKGKGKEPAKESEQEEEEQGTGDEGEEGEAE